MSDFFKTPLGAGEYEQVTSLAEGTVMEVVYTVNGKQGRSIGSPTLGVPVPGGATINSVEVRS